MEAVSLGTVLVVDDEEIVRRSAEKILMAGGYRVLLARNGTAGLEVLAREQVDLALTDLKMPDMDGLAVLRQVRENWPDTEVVVVTGYGTVQSAVEALKLGAYDYIEKPFTPDQLLHTVSRCIERQRLLRENRELRQVVHARYRMENIIGVSEPMQKVFQMIATIAPTGTTVLITGESGTGKELVAKAIHHNSPRRDGPFLVVDCGTIPDHLMEAELFGHVRGAFTGATENRRGLLETANRGTIFFDEIGNLGLALQAKLLRVLQEKEFRPVGGRGPVKADIRIIAATNRDLAAAVAAGDFREDLFYRLNVFPILLPPLRERKEDIPPLAEHFLQRYTHEADKEAAFSAGAMKRLILHDWPGNVRELENVVHRAVIVCTGRTIRPEHILITGKAGTAVPRTAAELKALKKELRARSVADLERTFLIEALDRNGWNVTRAADEVGMQRTQFQSLLRRYRIRKD